MRLSAIAACAVTLVSLPLVISGCGGGGAANSPPTASITGGPSGDTEDTTPTFSWTGADSDGQVTWYAYRVDNGTWFSVRSDVTSATIGPLSAGQHTFEVRSQDDDSAFSDIASRSFTVIETNSPPTVTITGGPSGETIETSPTFSWTGSDSDGQVVEYWYRVDAAPWTVVGPGVTQATVGPLALGEHIFEVRSKDDDDAFSEIASRSFTVIEINSPPTVAITGGPAGDTPDTTPTFSWTGGDSDGQVVEYWYRVDAAPWTVVGPGVTQATVGPLALGEHVFKLKSKDDDGDYSEVARRSFTVIPNTGDVPIIVD